MYGRGKRLLAWVLVAMQMILLAALVWLPGPRAWVTPGWLIAVAVTAIAAAALLAVAAARGLGAGLTASPLPSPGARLRTTGAYACVRHPIYSALLLGGAGVAVLVGRVTQLGVWPALLGLLLVKTRLEERELAARFPGYRAYAAATPRLFPNPLRCWDRLRSGRPGRLRGDGNP
jgi:protein-S-isoprenylcysteine O-methyltransferase Ste14